MMKSFKQYLKETPPTNWTNSTSTVPGFSSGAEAPVAGYDPNLFKDPVTDDLLSQDYQTPDESGLAIYRFSNVYPVEKLSEKDIDNMVSASKEYDQLMDEQRFGRRDYMKEKLQRVIDTIRSLKEEMAVGGAPTNNASSGAIAGLPPDTPPVKKKKKYIYGGHGSRKMWLVNKK